MRAGPSPPGASTSIRCEQRQQGLRRAELGFLLVRPAPWHRSAFTSAFPSVQVAAAAGDPEGAPRGSAAGPGGCRLPAASGCPAGCHPCQGTGTRTPGPHSPTQSEVGWGTAHSHALHEGCHAEHFLGTEFRELWDRAQCGMRAQHSKHCFAGRHVFDMSAAPVPLPPLIVASSCSGGTSAAGGSKEKLK